MSTPGDAMVTRVRVPKLGETSDVVVVENWLVAVGDRIEAGTPIVSVETDKAVVDIVSPVAGVLVEILVEVDDEAKTGEHLCVIRE
ncbi:MAG: hypothetical protein H0V26_06630 [Solirubrobacterales bacterium]|nr:hypothetical protein [Solirubrobacterales bacterium]